MNAANIERILRHIRQLAGEREAPLPDAELLRRYLATRDESAFATLVRRHGPIVFAVCQSVLRRRHDAEDAFQAVFLVLARKAGSIRRPESLSSFLHGVAYRMSLKARADNARRQSREAKAPFPEPAVSANDDLSWGELRAVLHAELSALPERFREPLVLCYLEGLTQDEAARRLGWTPATVKGRLQRGREKLRRRLERRGVALTAALAAALTGQALAETAVRTVPSFTIATATSAATALASSFARSWLPMKLAMLSAVLLSAGLVAGGVATRSPKPRSEETPAPQAEKPAAERPTPKPAVDAHGDPLPPGAIARLGTIRFNHGTGLSTLLFSKDGKTLFSEGGGTLRIWDAETGRERDHFPTRQHNFGSQMVLMPDGKTLLSLDQPSSGVQDTVHVWDIAQKKEIRTLLLPVRRLEWSATRRNALSPDGSLGAINLPTEMPVFDLSTGRELYKLAKGGKEIRDVVFAGSDRLVTADAKQTIDVWEARTGKLVRRFAHGGPAEVLAASSDGRWLATLEHHTYAIDRQLDKDVIHVWDLKTGRRKHALTARPKRWFMRMQFAPDGKQLAASTSGGGHEVTVWDVETGERVREIDNVGSLNLAFSPTGERLAIVHGRSKMDLWDVKTGRCLSAEDPRHARAAALAFAPAGDRVVLLDYSSLSTWETETGRRKGSIDLPPHHFFPPTSALSSDGRYALSFMGGWENCQPFVWDVAARRRLQLLKSSCQMGAFSPDSTLLATWEWKEKWVIRLRNVATSREVRSFPADGAALPYLSFTADGQTLLAAGKKVVAYDIASGKERFSWQMKPVPDHSGVRKSEGGKERDPNSRRAWRGFTASASGSLIAVTLNGGLDGHPLPERIALFDARTGKLLRRWSDTGKPSSEFERLCFSPDDQLLTSSDGQVVHLWETVTGKEIRTFHGHRGDIEFLAFSHDGRRLASASWDSTVLIWDATGQADAATTDAALEESWKALLEDDAGRAHRAVWMLARTPAKSIPLLKERLRPVTAVGREKLNRLIQDLDSEQFAVRARALAELQKLDELAEPALRRTLQGKPTLEQRRRIEPMLAKLDAAIPSGEALRSLRALRVLEHAGTPEARRLLRELATGAEAARLTREAAAALTRLNRRSR